MFQGIPGSWPIALLVALGPACTRLWRDRALLRFEHDPTLPERLLARRRQNQALSIICSVMLAVGWGAAVSWAFPVLVIADIAAAHPFRRRIFGETWSLFAYLSFACRISIANFAFWIALATTPLFASLFGTPAWLAPAFVAVILLAWNERFSDVTRFLLRVQPIADAALRSRFEALARRSSASMPRFDVMDLRGGVLVNAFALPSRRRSSVIFTDTLLARLEPDETAAICAHEIAHLEYYDRRRLQRIAMVNRALLVAAAFVTPASHALPPFARELTWIAWPLAVLSALVWRAKDRQKNETASDQRAVALTGNPEALAQALVKLYAWGRVPRRFAAEYEQRATHPSLARRIRDIRAAAGVPPPTPASVEAFVSSDGAARVAFEPSRVRWTDGDGSEHALAYAGLRELRVHAKGTATPRLIAIDRGGHKWDLPIAAADAGRVQTALDAIDGLLVHHAAPSRVSGLVTRMFALLAVTVAVVAGQFGAVAATMIALLRPAPALVAATGTACIAAAFLSVRDGARLDWPSALTLGVIGIGAWILAYLKRKDAAHDASGKPVAVLALLAAISVTLVAAGGVTPIRFHQAARTLPSAAVLLLAVATALLVERRRALRVTAVGTAVLAAVLMAAGSMSFLERAGRDPLLVQAGAPHVTELTGAPLGEYDLPAGVSDVTLSPWGAAYMVSRYDDDEGDPRRQNTWRHEVARLGAAARPVVADTAVFVDDDRLLTANFADEGVDLREVPVSDPRMPIWQLRVDGVASGRLSVSDDGARWRLLGRAPDLSIVRAQGDIGAAAVDVHRWPIDRRLAIWADNLESSGDVAVAMQKSYDLGPLSGPRFLGIVPLLLGTRARSTIWRLDAAGAIEAEHSALDAMCAPGAIDGALLCAAYDGAGTRVASVEATSGHITPIVTVRGRFAMLGARSARGWLMGWADSTPMAIRLASGDAFTLPRGRGGYVRALSPAGTRMAALVLGYPGARLRIYPLPSR